MVPSVRHPKLCSTAFLEARLTPSSPHEGSHQTSQSSPLSREQQERKIKIKAKRTELGRLSYEYFSGLKTNFLMRKAKKTQPAQTLAYCIDAEKLVNELDKLIQTQHNVVTFSSPETIPLKTQILLQRLRVTRATFTVLRTTAHFIQDQAIATFSPKQTEDKIQPVREAQKSLALAIATLARLCAKDCTRAQEDLQKSMKRLRGTDRSTFVGHTRSHDWSRDLIVNNRLYNHKSDAQKALQLPGQIRKEEASAHEWKIIEREMNEVAAAKTYGFRFWAHYKSQLDGLVEQVWVEKLGIC